MELQTSKPREIWIGMVEVSPLPDCDLLVDVRGAFVNVLTWADGLQEYRRKALELMDHLHLELVSIEGAEPLTSRSPTEELDDEIVRIANEVRSNPHAIMYSTFHTWNEKVQ